MSKIKYVLLLIVNTVVVTGLYYYIGNELMVPYVVYVYMIMTVVAICGYALLCMHNNNEIAKAKLSGKELDANLIAYRKRRIKLFMACFFPFVFTFVFDCIYLFALPFYQNLINSLR